MNSLTRKLQTEVAEEVIEFTYTIRKLGTEMTLRGDCLFELLLILRNLNVLACI